MNSLGRALRIMRAYRGKSRLAVSVAAEITSSHYSQIENGKAGATALIFGRIAKALGTSADEILRMASQLEAGKWKP